MNDSQIIDMMIAAFGKRSYVEHALKVYGYALAIGGTAGLSDEELRVLRAAAILHDIGIPGALEKRGSAAGPYQEAEGEALAKVMLSSQGDAFAARVASLVGKHHTEAAAQNDLTLQVLMEADYLVNLSDGYAGDAATVCERFFKTEAGIRFIKTLFDL